MSAAVAAAVVAMNLRLSNLSILFRNKAYSEGGSTSSERRDGVLIGQILGCATEQLHVSFFWTDSGCKVLSRMSLSATGNRKIYCGKHLEPESSH